MLTPDVLSTTQTVQVLVPVYVGGRGSLWGGAQAAFPIVFLTGWLDDLFSDAPGVDLIVYSFFADGRAGLCATRADGEMTDDISQALKRAASSHQART